jgi:hypothetical protein
MMRKWTKKKLLLKSWLMREDEAIVLLEMEGADSDEDVVDALPVEPNQGGFSEYTVDDSPRNEWEYC